MSQDTVIDLGADPPRLVLGDGQAAVSVVPSEALRSGAASAEDVNAVRAIVRTSSMWLAELERIANRARSAPPDGS